jgi:hypothetical protein
MMQPALRISRAVKQAIREAAGYAANTSAAVAPVGSKRRQFMAPESAVGKYRIPINIER